MNWHAVDLVQMKMDEMERMSRESWKYQFMRKRSEHSKKNETDPLYVMATHVLKEMMESDNAQNRLQAAEIVMRYSTRSKRGIRFSN